VNEAPPLRERLVWDRRVNEYIVTSSPPVRSWTWHQSGAAVDSQSAAFCALHGLRSLPVPQRRPDGIGCYGGSMLSAGGGSAITSYSRHPSTASIIATLLLGTFQCRMFTTAMHRWVNRWRLYFRRVPRSVVPPFACPALARIYYIARAFQLFWPRPVSRTRSASSFCQRPLGIRLLSSLQQPAVGLLGAILRPSDSLPLNFEASGAVRICLLARPCGFRRKPGIAAPVLRPRERRPRSAHAAPTPRAI
jgi:hypothetical protein